MPTLRAFSSPKVFPRIDLTIGDDTGLDNKGAAARARSFFYKVTQLHLCCTLAQIHVSDHVLGI